MLLVAAGVEEVSNGYLWIMYEHVKPAMCGHHYSCTWQLMVQTVVVSQA